MRVAQPAHRSLILGADGSPKRFHANSCYHPKRLFRLFVFRVFEEGESYFLDPWILFWVSVKTPRLLQRFEKVEDVLWEGETMTQGERAHFLCHRQMSPVTELDQAGVYFPSAWVIEARDFTWTCLVAA
ncbi:MAG TPA: hypothetical protein VGP72_18160 [Planctomycetota bacterium]|jgi:hypothetical protein